MSAPKNRCTGCNKPASAQQVDRFGLCHRCASADERHARTLRRIAAEEARTAVEKERELKARQADAYYESALGGCRERATS